MRYVYHYFAMRQLGSGETQYFDGLICRDGPLTGEWDEYRRLKADIADQMAGENPEAMTLCSLTLLAKPEDGCGGRT